MLTKSIALAALAVVAAAAPMPPNIPSASTAESELAQLTVAPQGSQDGYSRAKFPHWIQQGNNCDTREVVLKRDGTDVVTSSSCAATSGSWYSPYDGATWTASSDVDIDHVVPLSNAWKACFSHRQQICRLTDVSLVWGCIVDDRPTPGVRQ